MGVEMGSESVCSVSLSALRHLGLVSPQTRPELLRKSLLAMVLIFQASIVSVWAVTLYQSLGDVQKVSLNFYLFMAFFNAELKALHTLRHGRHLQRMYLEFDELFVSFEDKFNLPRKLSPLKVEKTARKIVICWFYGSAFIVVTFAIVPLLVSYLQYDPKRDGTWDRPMMLDTWWPIDAKGSPSYELTYLFYVTSLATCVSYQFHYNGACWALVSRLNHRFDILQYVMRNMKYLWDGRKMLLYLEEHDELNEEVPVNRTAKEVLYDSEYLSGGALCYLRERSGDEKRSFRARSGMLPQSNLNLSIQYHQRILSLCEKLEIFMSPILAVDILTSLIILCVCGFLTSIAQDNESVVLVSEAFVSFGFSLVMFCTLSSDLAAQSVAVSQAAYDSDWCDAPRGDKLSLLIMMARAQRTVHLTAGKFNPVTMETVLAVLRIAYSNFMVLRNLHAD